MSKYVCVIEAVVIAYLLFLFMVIECSKHDDLSDYESLTFEEMVRDSPSDGSEFMYEGKRIVVIPDRSNDVS